MKPVRILFVDDQPEVLSGLRRMCRMMRKMWEVSFALGGEEALTAMQEKQFDVLVTDMRMPGVDGVQVLKAALELQPQMVRIVLSGQYDVDYFIRSGWPAHRFLSKPCEAEQLQETIDQVLKMRSLFDDQQLKSLVTQADRLPALPSIYLEIEKELNASESSMQRVGEIIASDIGITAKVLQMVNSPIFGSRRKVESPTQAVVMLGADVIKSLALYIQSCSEMQVPDGISIEKLAAHSMFVGRLARQIAKDHGEENGTCSDAFLAGVLQNIGSLLLMSSYPDKYREMIRRAEAESRRISDVEVELFGGNHAKVGAYLLSLWGLDSEVVEAVAYHINPSKCPREKPPFTLTAVHIANALEKEPGLGGALINNDFDFEYLERQGMLANLPRWQQLHQQLVGQGE